MAIDRVTFKSLLILQNGSLKIHLDPFFGSQRGSWIQAPPTGVSEQPQVQPALKTDCLSCYQTFLKQTLRTQQNMIQIWILIQNQILLQSLTNPAEFVPNIWVRTRSRFVSQRTFVAFVCLHYFQQDPKSDLDSDHDPESDLAADPRTVQIQLGLSKELVSERQRDISGNELPSAVALDCLHS